MDFVDHIQQRLRALQAEGLLRSARTIQGRQGPEFTIDGRSVICLCSNNYLGLADHPKIAAAALAGIDRFSFGACAARHITGSSSAHVDAESAIASFLEQPRALFFTTGYDANLGTIQALASRETLVLSDALNHASLIDGCRLARANVRIYRHRDPDHVEELLRAERHRYTTALIVTESVFSMDGDQAPLRALRAISDRYQCALMVDEAHALGVVGPGGRGLCAEQAVRPDVTSGTFGKAFGASGAFVAGAAPIIQWIENRARSYVFSTASSPAIPMAAMAALQLVREADASRVRLHGHATALRRGLRELGYRVPEGNEYIIPVLLGSPGSATQLSQHLLELGVFVHGIRPPTVPVGTSRLRVTPMATHEPGHIEFALNAFRSARTAHRGER